MTKRNYNKVEVNFRGGVVEAVDYDKDTCTVLIEGAQYTDVPIHYHCDDTEEDKGGSSPFVVDDKVICLFEMDSIREVIGFQDGRRPCEPKVFFTIPQGRLTIDYLDFVGYSLLQGKDKIDFLSNVGAFTDEYGLTLNDPTEGAASSSIQRDFLPMQKSSAGAFLGKQELNVEVNALPLTPKITTIDYSVATGFGVPTTFLTFDNYYSNVLYSIACYTSRVVNGNIYDGGYYIVSCYILTENKPVLKSISHYSKWGNFVSLDFSFYKFAMTVEPIIELETNGTLVGFTDGGTPYPVKPFSYKIPSLKNSVETFDNIYESTVDTTYKYDLLGTEFTNFHRYNNKGVKSIKIKGKSVPGALGAVLQQYDSDSSETRQTESGTLSISSATFRGGCEVYTRAYPMVNGYSYRDAKSFLYQNVNTLKSSYNLNSFMEWDSTDSTDSYGNPFKKQGFVTASVFYNSYLFKEVYDLVDIHYNVSKDFISYVEKSDNIFRKNFSDWFYQNPVTTTPITNTNWQSFTFEYDNVKTEIFLDNVSFVMENYSSLGTLPPNTVLSKTLLTLMLFKVGENVILMWIDGELRQLDSSNSVYDGLRFLNYRVYKDKTKSIDFNKYVSFSNYSSVGELNNLIPLITGRTTSCSTLPFFAVSLNSDNLLQSDFDAGEYNYTQPYAEDSHFLPNFYNYMDFIFSYGYAKDIYKLPKEG